MITWLCWVDSHRNPTKSARSVVPVEPACFLKLEAFLLDLLRGLIPENKARLGFGDEYDFVGVKCEIIHSTLKDREAPLRGWLGAMAWKMGSVGPKNLRLA